jgi:cytochrome c
MQTHTKALISAAVAVVINTTAWAADVDAGAAEALMKKSGCNKCHSLDKKKEGPSFQETAAKYKGKADAEESIFKQLTTSPKIKIDGKEEVHEGLKTTKDDEVRNVARWILSR